MSFSISLQCFENGTFSKFKRSIAWDAFGPYARPCQEGLELWYSDQYCGVLYLEDDEEIDGLSINRPGRPCFDGIYSILSKTPSLLYWSDACAVANTAVIPGLPSWVVPALGQPAIVNSAEDIITFLEQEESQPAITRRIARNDNIPSPFRRK